MKVLTDYPTGMRLFQKLGMYGLVPAPNHNGVALTRKIWVENSLKADPGKAIADYGTFKDSLRAPVHRWFKYPAGYSYKLVDAKIRQYGLGKKNTIIDPFVGCGTTALEAKRYGIKSIGIEAHPFVYWVAETKLNWTIDLSEVADAYADVISLAKRSYQSHQSDHNDIPELVHKCYSEKNLSSLLSIRNSINEVKIHPDIKNFLLLALTDTLRNAAKVGTGWPYIAPTKIHERAIEKDAFAEFRSQVSRMIDDLIFMQKYYSNLNPMCLLINGDARTEYKKIKAQSVDLALTSPPYLNNYDYADRTRLETYFLGWYKSWGEITEQVRDRLMMSATTQVQRSDFVLNYGLNESIKEADSKLFYDLAEKIKQLRECRDFKGGKKSYDCVVAGYFNDMLEVLRQIYRILKPGADFIMVLGDSAPYGVYIPTHEILARIGLGLGYSSWSIEHLRSRGDKWPENPQRHKVKLKEVILTLTK